MESWPNGPLNLTLKMGHVSRLIPFLWCKRMGNTCQKRVRNEIGNVRLMPKMSEIRERKWVVNISKWKYIVTGVPENHNSLGFFSWSMLWYFPQVLFHKRVFKTLFKKVFKKPCCWNHLLDPWPLVLSVSTSICIWRPLTPGAW